MQAARADQDRLARAVARKLDTVVAAAPPVHAAAAWLASLKKDLSQTGDPHGKSLRAKRNGRQLDNVLDRDILLALLAELGADARANLLLIVSTMRTAIAMAQIHSVEDVLSTDDLARIESVLSTLESHLARFDQGLHNAFLSDVGAMANSRAAQAATADRTL